jgi:hypothetical protein
MNARRTLVASGAAAAALMLLASPAAMGAPATSHHAKVPIGSQLVSYTALANAPGIGIDGIYMGVSLDLPEASSSLSTGGVGDGLASLAWPGDIGGNAGNAVLILEPTAPSFVTILNDPVKAESRSTGSHHTINKTLPGTVMESSATHKLVTASSQTKLSLPLLGSLGAFSGSSSAKLVGPHTIRSVADSAFTNVNLAAGLIKISALTSRAVVVSNGKTSHGHAATTVTGVTIAGIPVTIDHDGIHLSKSILPTKTITALLAKTLKTLHLSFTFTPTTITRDGGEASYDSGALVLDYHPGTGTTNVAITLGRAGVQVDATPSLVSGAFTPPTIAGTSPGTTGTTAGGGQVGSLPAGSTSSLGPGGNQPPSVAHRLVDRASDILLAGGPTGLMIGGVIAAMIACAIGLPILAGRFLAAPADAACQEDDV